MLTEIVEFERQNGGCKSKAGYLTKVHSGHALVVCFAVQMTSGENFKKNVQR